MLTLSRFILRKTSDEWTGQGGVTLLERKDYIKLFNYLLFYIPKILHAGNNIIIAATYFI